MNRDRQGAACAVVLFALNAYVCSRLWSAQYLDRMGSIEGSFIAISRFVMAHWHDLRWFPAWFCGMPFLRVYQPGLHVTVAAVATVFHLTPQRSYHLLGALFYSLGPVTLFWLCDRLTGSRGYALAVGLVYSLFSPSILFSSVLRQDLGGWFLPRRYQVLIDYGEGPHIAALALLPLVIWSLDRAVTQSRRAFIPLSAALLGAVVVTNWTGTIGMVMALAGYFASRIGVIPLTGWFKAMGIGVLAYLLVCPWLPPSIIASVPGNAQASDGTYFGRFQLVMGVVLIAAVALLHLVLERTNADRNFRFFLYFFAISATVVLGKLWFDVSLVPQPHRFHLELEMAVIGSLLFPFTWLRRNWTLPVVFAALCILQLTAYHRYAKARTARIDITRTNEYRMAKWFEEHVPNDRVFAPGNVSIWMNAFVDTPQMVGCCGQSVPSFEQSIAFFTIYSDMNAGDRAAEISELWLKAYGVGAIGVMGSSFAHPKKFEGLLPVLWRDGDNAVYQVPRRSASLAHVIRPDQEVRRAPINGLDVEPLRPYVAALDDASLPPAEMQWVSGHQIRVTAPMTDAERVSLQISYAPGWSISANGRPVSYHADALGLMIVEPGCAGPCTIDLAYDGGAEAIWTRIAQGFGLFVCAMSIFFRPSRH